jgi:hypothetical protein
MKRIGKATVAACAFTCAALFSIGWSEQGVISPSIESAQARVGRPLTPVSVAGVARRQTRRAYGYGAGAVGVGLGAAAIGTAAAVNGAPYYYGGAGYYSGGPYASYPVLDYRPAAWSASPAPWSKWTTGTCIAASSFTGHGNCGGSNEPPVSLWQSHFISRLRSVLACSSDRIGCNVRQH